MGFGAWWCKEVMAVNDVGQREGDSRWQAGVVHPRSRRWHSGCSQAQGKLPDAVLHITAPQNMKVHLLFVRAVSGPLVYLAGVLVDERLAVSSPRALTAQKHSGVLDCIQSSTARRARDSFLPLCPGESPPACSAASSSGAPAQEGLAPVGDSP